MIGKGSPTLFLSVAVILLMVVNSCKLEKEKVTEQLMDIPVPDFNSDSAYFFVEKQVKFGPRIPNSRAHQEAGDYLVSQFKLYGATVTEQEFVATTFDNQKLNLRNIIASFYPTISKRILLAAHWDTRPFADKDTQNKNAPFDGANDGASGVGVLLEIARVLSKADSLAVGVDIILFDGEDWGEQEPLQGRISTPQGLDSWWCLGSQHWSKNKHKKNYSASYGILLDMVGARRSQFFREGASMTYAPKIVEKVWALAGKIGYSDYFVKKNVGTITDDHIYVNQYAKIPMIDIVHYQAGIGFFGDYHHSQKDNLTLINKETLKAVGSTLLHVIYYEEP
jgi:glutaminyl-peptide cyclotransferase